MRGVFISVWLCDAGYVGYTCRHLHQGSAIRNHLREQHDMEPEDIAESLRILRKCQNKFDCLIFEMFFFYQRTETNAKQTLRFNSRQIICLEQSLLKYFNLLLFFLLHNIFSPFLHILSHFDVRYISIVYILFLTYLC